MENQEPASETSKAVVPVAPNASANAIASPDWMRELQTPDFWTSLDVRNPDEQLLLFKARMQSDISVREAVNQELVLTHILAHQAEKEDPESGEVMQLVRFALIDEQGRVWEAFGQGIKRSIRTLVTAFGPPPWKPGKRCRIATVKTGKGFLMPILAPVIDTASPKPKTR